MTKDCSYCIWITGLPCSGKTTLAMSLKKIIIENVCILDGDLLRSGLNSDLTFSLEDRCESVRRTSEISKILVDSGVITIVSIISPLRKQREQAKFLFKNDNFYEVYLSTPFTICKERDVKGHYKKAEDGLIRDFTGVNSPYEPPLSPHIELDTTNVSIEEASLRIMESIKQ